MNTCGTIVVSETDKSTGLYRTYIREYDSKTNISPYFPSLFELFDWMRTNYWILKPSDSWDPWAVIRVEGSPS